MIWEIEILCGWGMDKMDEGGEKTQASSYKIIKSWGCEV